MLFCSSEHFYNYGGKKIYDKIFFKILYKIFYQPNARPALSHPFSSDSEFPSLEVEPKFAPPALAPAAILCSSSSRCSTSQPPLLSPIIPFSDDITSNLQSRS